MCIHEYLLIKLRVYYKELFMQLYLIFCIWRVPAQDGLFALIL